MDEERDARVLSNLRTEFYSFRMELRDYFNTFHQRDHVLREGRMVRLIQMLTDLHTRAVALGNEDLLREISIEIEHIQPLLQDNLTARINVLIGNLENGSIQRSHYSTRMSGYMAQRSIQVNQVLQNYMENDTPCSPTSSSTDTVSTEEGKQEDEGGRPSNDPSGAYQTPTVGNSGTGPHDPPGADSNMPFFDQVARAATAGNTTVDRLIGTLHQEAHPLVPHVNLAPPSLQLPRRRRGQRRLFPNQLPFDSQPQRRSSLVRRFEQVHQEEATSNPSSLNSSRRVRQNTNSSPESAPVVDPQGGQATDQQDSSTDAPNSAGSSSD